MVQSYRTKAMEEIRDRERDEAVAKFTKTMEEKKINI